MARRRPWCRRAKCTHDEFENNKTILYAKSKLMDFSFWLMTMTTMCCLSAFAAFIVFAIFPNQQYPKDDPLTPGYWEVTLPLFGIVILIGFVGAVISTTIRWIGVHHLKEYLIPIRCHRCPKCFYDLSARPRDEDLCPECGSYTPRRECVRLWCKLLRSRI